MCWCGLPAKSSGMHRMIARESLFPLTILPTRSSRLQVDKTREKCEIMQGEGKIAVRIQIGRNPGVSKIWCYGFSYHLSSPVLELIGQEIMSPSKPETEVSSLGRKYRYPDHDRFSHNPGQPSQAQISSPAPQPQTPKSNRRRKKILNRRS